MLLSLINRSLNNVTVSVYYLNPFHVVCLFFFLTCLLLSMRSSGQYLNWDSIIDLIRTHHFWKERNFATPAKAFSVLLIFEQMFVNFQILNGYLRVV